MPHPDRSRSWRILHTADWHIGQYFYGYDRHYEHISFLEWLVGRLAHEDIDVLLISGDVFDVANPSSLSIKAFYTFLNDAIRTCPDLQIIVTAGNHDSPSRLEAPLPLLESTHVHIIGSLERKEGAIDWDKVAIPLSKKGSTERLWCMALPFLRMGDYNPVAESDHPYGAGVRAVYEQCMEHIGRMALPGEPVIAMGHLHAMDAEMSDLDSGERPILGGLEYVPLAAFHEDLKYVALGHIHKAQQLGPRGHIRYAGSPLPLSFSEHRYDHKVWTVEIGPEGAVEIDDIATPLFVRLLRVPQRHAKIEEVIRALSELPDEPEGQAPPPFLQVNVLLERPEPALRHHIEEALKGKSVRLAKIDVRYPEGKGATSPGDHGQVALGSLRPIDLLRKAYEARYRSELPPEIKELFKQALHDIESNEIDT